MSEAKTLKTRLALLYKTYAEWETIKTTFIPLKGEVCFCNIPAGTGIFANEPCLAFKVGDGVKDPDTEVITGTTFANLNWASGTAADVYAWAKKQNLDFDDLDSTFRTKLETFIQEHSAGCLEVFDVTEYGFDSNLRENQTVSGNALVSAVLAAIRTQKKNVALKAGDYIFNVVETVYNETGSTITSGFACVGANVDLTEAKPRPFPERIIFVYNSSLGNTISLYSKDKDLVTISQLTEQVTILNNKINTKASQDQLNQCAEAIVELLDSVEALITQVGTLNTALRFKMILGHEFDDSGAQVDESQNDFRIYIPDDYFTSKQSETGLSLKGSVIVQILDDTLDHFKRGNYDNYEEEFTNSYSSAVPTPGRAVSYQFEIATRAQESDPWTPITAQVTDKFYPSIGFLLEFFPHFVEIGDTTPPCAIYSRRISFSDFAHFHTSRDWYAGMTNIPEVDDTTIVVNTNNKLALHGYASASQGQIPAKDDTNGLTWINPVSTAQLEQAVENASQSAVLSGQYATNSGNSAVEAHEYEIKAAAHATDIKNSFWKGTAEEYNQLTTILPDTIYMILI